MRFLIRFIESCCFIVLLVFAAMTFWIFPIMYVLRREEKRKEPFYCVLCREDVDEDPEFHAYKHWIS